MNIAFRWVTAITGATLLALQPGCAERPNTIADGPGYNEALVYGDVVSAVEASPGQWQITLDVQSVLTGPADAGRSPRLELNLGPAGSPPPPAQAHVVVLIACTGYPDCLPWSVAPHSVAFLPTKRPIAVVSGFDDPKVEKIAERVRQLRAANPLPRWQPAIQAMDVESANVRAPDGSKLPPPQKVIQLLEADR
jgi:hypothetical protein